MKKTIMIKNISYEFVKSEESMLHPFQESNNHYEVKIYSVGVS
ncbi:hypothetical protein [Lactococcus allomyrinae]|nr:hypothetical protein [Lactococcus allomyrinae]